MAEYIKCEALIAMCEENAALEWNTYTQPTSWADAFREFADIIENFPTADVVEVVRCKDCAWHDDEDNVCVNSRCSKSYYGCRVPREHFCSYGEKRDEE